MKALGSLHPDVAISYAQLGMAHMELGEYAYAVYAFQNALIIRRKTLSWRDEKIARLLNHIGCCLFEIGKWKEAEQAFGESLGIQRVNLKNIGVDVKDNVNVNVNDNATGADADANLGTNAEESVENISHHLLGIASALCNLGSIKLRMKLYNESLVFLDEALLIQQSVLGDNHSTVKNTKDSIDFVNEKASSVPIQEFINRKMMEVGLTNNNSGYVQEQSTSASASANANANVGNRIDIDEAGVKIGVGAHTLRTFKIPSPMGLFSDVMSLNGAEWIQVLEDIGGTSMPMCKGCTHDAVVNVNNPSSSPSSSSPVKDKQSRDPAGTLSSHPSRGNDLHWI